MRRRPTLSRLQRTPALPGFGVLGPRKSREFGLYRIYTAVRTIGPSPTALPPSLLSGNRARTRDGSFPSTSFERVQMISSASPHWDAPSAPCSESPTPFERVQLWPESRGVIPPTALHGSFERVQMGWVLPAFASSNPARATRVVPTTARGSHPSVRIPRRSTMHSTQ